ncbi:MAG TPA: glycosyl transferase family 1 [Chloroflexi bacterium]|nr:glycosyl transferase family 1 [Chloroflexota bacterium]|tara:strand:- start:1884 stop:2978 length:1095 start_codon:yes stop_codon:yes gene_type:complete
MKVLLASKALVVGAHHDKLRALASVNDVDVLAVVPDRWVESGQVAMAERPRPRGYEVEHVSLALNGHYHLYWFRELRRLVRRFRPDVLHIDEEPYNLASALACRDALDVGAAPVFFAWQNLSRRYPPPVRWIENYVLRCADGIAGTERARQVLVSKGHRRASVVIPQFGVDPDIFVPNVNPRSNGQFVIGYAGRLVPEKGVDVLIRAVRAIGGNSVLRIAGDGPTMDHLRRLEPIVNVEFVGGVPSEEMPSFYQDLDVFVLPSVGRKGWVEQFGRAAVEAMACGVPTIVSDMGELPSVVGDGGEIVPAGDVDALSTMLRTLRGEVGRRQELAVNGRERVLGRFTTRAVAQATASFYRAVVSNRS